VALVRGVGAVHPVAVEQPGPRVGQVAVPDEVGALAQLDALDLAPALGVEQAQLDPLGVLRIQREVDAFAVPGGAQGRGPAAPDGACGGDAAGTDFQAGACGTGKGPNLAVSGDGCRGAGWTGRLIAPAATAADAIR